MMGLMIGLWVVENILPEDCSRLQILLTQAFAELGLPPKLVRGRILFGDRLWPGCRICEWEVWMASILG